MTTTTVTSPKAQEAVAEDDSHGVAHLDQGDDSVLRHFQSPSPRMDPMMSSPNSLGMEGVDVAEDDGQGVAHLDQGDDGFRHLQSPGPG